MAITLDLLQRPKQSGTEDINLDIQAGTAVETDVPAGTGIESIFIPYNLQNLDQPSFIVADCTTTNASTTVTTINGGFVDVRNGDLVTGTGIAASTLVASKLDNDNIILDTAATAAGTVSLTFDPSGGNPINPTLFGIEIQFIRQTTKLITRVIYHHYDGSLQDVQGTVANSSFQNTLEDASLDLDVILTALRVPRNV